MELHILEHSLKVASIEKEGIEICTHGLIKLAFLASKTRCKFFSLTETPEDYTIIVDEEGFKGEGLSLIVPACFQASGALISVFTCATPSVTLELSVYLNISVFFFFSWVIFRLQVRERDLPMVMHTLSSEFTLFRVVNGETVAAHNLGITNGFVKPKLVPRPIIHPLSSPSNMFCVTSLDPDTLPSVATLLMDVMFYSGGIVVIQSHFRLFPNNVLFTSASGELWKMVRIGGQPLGFDECGIVAQISEPLATADIPAYYISTFKFDHALVPEENIQSVIRALRTESTAAQ
uniref:Cytosolic arginine sensor for mTORC1 subunit 2 n=1 Tax=Fundulus heteroclitus TaxID=8078 RepID=A0A3Q2Q3E3_FUNHE